MRKTQKRLWPPVREILLLLVHLLSPCALRSSSLSLVTVHHCVQRAQGSYNLKFLTITPLFSHLVQNQRQSFYVPLLLRIIFLCANTFADFNGDHKQKYCETRLFPWTIFVLYGAWRGGKKRKPVLVGFPAEGEIRKKTFVSAFLNGIVHPKLACHQVLITCWCYS